MSRHLGFRVSAITAENRRAEDQFETKEGARHCAQVLDRQGAFDIECAEVIEHEPEIWQTGPQIEHRSVEWYVHMVGIAA